MGAREVINFVRHITNMGAASGNKRVAYAFGNIILIAICVAAAIGVRMLFPLIFSEYFIVALIGFFVCIVATLLFFLQGFVGQIALIFISAIGIADPEERGGNIAACIISILTVAAGVIVFILFLNSLNTATA